jgi:hypothetical protein
MQDRGKSYLLSLLLSISEPITQLLCAVFTSRERYSTIMRSFGECLQDQIKQQPLPS